MEVSHHHRSVQNPPSVFCSLYVFVAPKWLCRKAAGSRRQRHGLFFPCQLSVNRLSSLYILSKSEQGQRFKCLQTWSRHLWCAVAAQTWCVRRAIHRRMAELWRLKTKGEAWNSHLYLPQWGIARSGLHQTMASIGHNTHWEGQLCTLALQAVQLPLHLFRLCMHTDVFEYWTCLSPPMTSHLRTSDDSGWLCLMKCCICEHSLSLFYIPC